MESIHPLVADASQAAWICGVSRAHWWNLHKLEQCPAPIRLGRKPLWRRAELDDWLKAGCPDRAHWHWPKEGGRD